MGEGDRVIYLHRTLKKAYDAGLRDGWNGVRRSTRWQPDDPRCWAYDAGNQVGLNDFRRLAARVVKEAG